MRQLPDPNRQSDSSPNFLLLGLVALTFVVANTYFAPKPVAQEESPKATTESVNANGGDTLAAQGNNQVPSEGAALSVDAPEEHVRIEIPVADQSDTSAVRGGYEVELSSHGAQITSFVLNGYQESGEASANSIDLVKLKSEGRSLHALEDRKLGQLKPDASYTVIENKKSPEGTHRVVFKRQLQTELSVEREYVFTPGTFLFEMNTRVRNVGQSTRSIALSTSSVGASDETQGGFFQAGGAQFAAVCANKDDRETFTQSDLEDGIQKLEGASTYGALSWHYFISALLPSNTSDIEGCDADTFKNISTGESSNAAKMGIVQRLHYKEIILQPGETKSLTSRVFMGPKQLQLLNAVGANLDDNLEFGMFEFISKPILFVLVKLHSVLGNFGLAIILLTLLIKLLTFPLTHKSYTSMQKMKVVAPELKALQKKYGHDRALLGQKQMEMYKEKGINPVAGCLPMLLQMPIWFALFRTILNSVELYQQPFVGWITDLSQADSLPALGIPLLPFIVGALMFAQTAFQPTPQDQPQMKYIMMGMPVFMVVLYFSMPSGLSVYTITNTVVTVIQQWFIKQRFASETVESS